jgi:hypothetical protein
MATVMFTTDEIKEALVGTVPTAIQPVTTTPSSGGGPTWDVSYNTGGGPTPGSHSSSTNTTSTSGPGGWDTSFNHAS